MPSRPPSKMKKHFWYYRNEILSNVRQQPEVVIYALSTCIITLINNNKFTHQETKETLKITLLQLIIRSQSQQLDPAAGSATTHKPSPALPLQTAQILVQAVPEGQALTINKISHWLSRATTFSKLDAKDGFWSIQLNEKSSYLTTFNTYKEDNSSCTCLSA